MSDVVDFNNGLLRSGNEGKFIACLIGWWVMLLGKRAEDIESLTNLGMQWK
jgi:hypothetical protein